MNSLVYKPIHFSVKELVHPDVYAIFGNDSLDLLDPRILWTADQLRDKFGQAFINTWAWDKTNPRKYSGLRPWNSTIGAEFSCHKYGKALDMIFTKITAQEVRDYIKKNPNEEAFKFITRIEEFSGMNWLHIDNLPTMQKGIKFFKP